MTPYGVIFLILARCIMCCMATTQVTQSVVTLGPSTSSPPPTTSDLSYSSVQPSQSSSSPSSSPNRTPPDSSVMTVSSVEHFLSVVRGERRSKRQYVTAPFNEYVHQRSSYLIYPSPSSYVPPPPPPRLIRPPSIIPATPPPRLIVPPRKAVDYVKQLPFNELLQQRIVGNRVPQCPCVIKPGSNKCIAYDSRFQAATIEEAITSFPDVTLDPRLLDDILGAPIGSKSFLCETLECQTCASLLADRLRKIGLLKPNVQLSIPVLPYVDPRNCRRFRFVRRYRDWQKLVPKQIPHYMAEAIKEGQRRLKRTTAMNISVIQGFGFRRNEPKTFTGRIAGIDTFDDPFRNKRNDPRVFGERFSIYCTERGTGDQDDNDLLNLCGGCWTWRKLPDDYFPPLLNELVCMQGEENYCLSGWGTCVQRFRNVDVLKRIGGNDYQPITVSVGTCCGCRVRAGTEIHALVVGGRV